MKCYLLLRNNVESGPYSLGEIAHLGLLADDLIWIEGQSQSWRFPTEISELASLVQKSPEAAEKKEAPTPLDAPKKVYVALPDKPEYKPAKPVVVDEALLPPADDLLPAAEVVELSIRTKSKPYAFRFAENNKNNRLMWMAALCTGLFAGAFMIKKMVDNLDEKERQQATAAALPATTYPHPEAKDATASYRNALTTETVAVDTAIAAPKPVKKKVSLKKQVTLSANDFKKGVFGGINELSFTVRNKSEHVLDKVTVEVAYLKPNGEVVKKETHHVKNVAPKSTKIFNIPPSNRGVDVKYRITNIQSHEAKAAMREL